MNLITRSKIKLVLIGIGCMGWGLLAQAGLIFSQPGSYQVHGKVICQKDKAYLVVGVGTQSAIPVRIEPMKYACQFYSEKTVKAILNFNSVKPPLNAQVVDGSMMRAMPESKLIPPVRMNAKTPANFPASSPVKK